MLSGVFVFLAFWWVEHEAFVEVGVVMEGVVVAEYCKIEFI